MGGSQFGGTRWCHRHLGDRAPQGTGGRGVTRWGTGDCRGGCKATPWGRDKGTARLLREGTRGHQGLCVPPSPFSLGHPLSSLQEVPGAGDRVGGGLQEAMSHPNFGVCVGVLHKCPHLRLSHLGFHPRRFRGAMLAANRGGALPNVALVIPKQDRAMREGTPLMHPSSLDHPDGPWLGGSHDGAIGIPSAPAQRGMRRAHGSH